MKRTLGILDRERFRPFLAGQVVSMLGSSLRSTALAWTIAQDERPSVSLALLVAANTAPALLLTPVAGAFVDRRPKLRTFRQLTLLAAAVSLAASIALSTGTAGRLGIYAFAFLWGAVGAFEVPTRQVLVAELAGREHLLEAVSVHSAAFQMSRAVGPALAGALLAREGAAACVLLDAASYLFLLWRTRQVESLEPSHGSAQRRGTWSMLRSEIALSTNLGGLLVLMVTMSVAGSPYSSQLAAVAVRDLHVGALEFGWLSAASGMGSLAAAVCLLFAGSRFRKEALSVLGATAVSMALIAVGFQRTLVMTGLLFATAGFGVIVFFLAANTLLQTQVSDHVRGRMMAVYSAFYNGGTPIGALIVGLIAEGVGPSTAVQISGYVCLTGVVAFFALRRR